MKVRQAYANTDGTRSVVWFGSRGIDTSTDPIGFNAYFNNASGTKMTLTFKKAESGVYIAHAVDPIDATMSMDVILSLSSLLFTYDMTYKLVKQERNIYSIEKLDYMPVVGFAKVGYSVIGGLDANEDAGYAFALYNANFVDAESNDIFAESNADKHYNFSEGIYAVKQYLEQHLSIIQNELWYNYQYGLPLFDKRANKAIIDSAALNIIYSDPEVIEVIDYTSTINDNHDYYASFTLKSSFGNLTITV